MILLIIFMFIFLEMKSRTALFVINDVLSKRSVKGSSKSPTAPDHILVILKVYHGYSFNQEHIVFLQYVVC